MWQLYLHFWQQIIRLQSQTTPDWQKVQLWLVKKWLVSDHFNITNNILWLLLLLLENKTEPKNSSFIHEMQWWGCLLKSVIHYCPPCWCTRDGNIICALVGIFVDQDRHDTFLGQKHQYYNRHVTQYVKCWTQRTSLKYLCVTFVIIALHLPFGHMLKWANM